MIPPNPSTTTRIRAFDSDAVAEAAEVIRAGGLVAMPTETVYGLAADATDARAVAGIYAAKGRPSFNPLIVHVASRAAAGAIARFDADAEALAAALWPGPLTLVLPLAEEAGIAPLVTAGLTSVAVRVPAHPAMQHLLAACGRPLAAPSANRSGTISPTTAAHVVSSLEGRVHMVIDAGPTLRGIESTILACTGGGVRLLRPGPVTRADVATIIGRPVVDGGDGIEAPGQLASHYAPSKPVRLNAAEAAADEWLIGFGPVDGDATLSAEGDLIEAAATLFERLHEADASPRPKIAVAPVPSGGLGEAIVDRLRRAAA